MTKVQCKQLVDSYLKWLKESIRIEELDSCCLISTPFLDRHNDEIEIYVEKRGDSLWLTDDGYTLSDLKQSNVFLDTTEKRQNHLKCILNGFGIQQEGDELCVPTSPKDFPQRKHNLIQAILAVNDMFVMGEESVLQLFKEDVEKFLREKGVPTLRDIKLSGLSGFDHKFDFGIAATTNHPEGILQTINRLTKDQATSLAFMVGDVKLARGETTLSAYAFLNDEENEINPDYLSALTAYKIKPLLWSRKDKEISHLLIS